MIMTTGITAMATTIDMMFDPLKSSTKSLNDIDSSFDGVVHPTLFKDWLPRVELVVAIKPAIKIENNTQTIEIVFI